MPGRPFKKGDNAGRRVAYRYQDRCAYHKTGAPPGVGAFFEAGCPVCEQKKADGRVTGDEPAPRAIYRRKKMVWKK